MCLASSSLRKSAKSVDGILSSRFFNSLLAKEGSSSRLSGRFGICGNRAGLLQEEENEPASSDSAPGRSVPGRPIRTGHGAEGNGEPVPAIDRDDGEREI